MNKLKTVITLCFFPFTGNTQSLWHAIPEQIVLWNEIYTLRELSNDIKITVKPFEISNQVTLAEYKIFLNEMKKDSGETVYTSLLPDTNIAPKNIREKYFHSGKYDNYPVVGISWDNALRYCRWMTLKNNSDSLKVIYRLPNLFEYFSAYNFLRKNAIDNDLNLLYSDWLMDACDESVYEFSKEENFALGYYYFHLKTDLPAMKRKRVIGKSFLYAYNQIVNHTHEYFYADEGYRQISFRIVKDTSSDAFEITDKKTYLHDGTYLYYQNPILQFWKIKPPVK